MDGLKLGFMTSLLKSGYHKWMPYYILALAFSIASQTLELLPIVPQTSKTEVLQTPSAIEVNLGHGAE